MAFQSVPDVVQTVITFTSLASTMVNILNWAFSGGYDQGEVDDLADAVDAAVDALWLPLISTSVTYLNTYAKGLESAVDLEATANAGTGNGAASGNAMTLQQSYVVKLGTGATGRSSRGRIYTMSSTFANMQTVRAVTTTYSSNWVDAVADLFTAVTAASGGLPVVVSRFTAGAPRTTGVYRPVTDIIGTNLNVDTQRRRVGK